MILFFTVSAGGSAMSTEQVISTTAEIMLLLKL
jgi:hypothetical protein